MNEPQPWDIPAPVSYQSAAAGPIALTPAGLQMLRRIRPWALFISIVFFLGSLLNLFLAGASVLVALLAPAGHAARANTGEILAGSALYGVIGIMLLVPAIFLFRLFLAIGRLAASGTEQNLEQAIASQFQYFRMFGILTIIQLVLLIGGIAVVVYMMASGMIAPP